MRNQKILLTGAHGFMSVLVSNSSAGEGIRIGSNFGISIGDTAGATAEEIGVEIDLSTTNSAFALHRGGVQVYDAHRHVSHL